MLLRGLNHFCFKGREQRRPVAQVGFKRWKSGGRGGHWTPKVGFKAIIQFEKGIWSLKFLYDYVPLSETRSSAIPYNKHAEPGGWHFWSDKRSWLREYVDDCENDCLFPQKQYFFYWVQVKVEETMAGTGLYCYFWHRWSIQPYVL